MAFQVSPGPPRVIVCMGCRRSSSVFSPLHERNWKLTHVCTPRTRALADPPT